MFEKFKKWMEYNPPSALSIDDWADFDEAYQKNAPIRYFIMKRIVRWFERQGDKIHRGLWWVKYRTTHRYHIIDTGLSPNYHDVPEKMLHANFTLLVDYVEQECAWMQITFDSEKQKEIFGWRCKIPNVLRFRRNWRSKELGLAHLDWEATLDDPSLLGHEQSPEQAASARDIKSLYLWWTEERPKREDIPYPLDETASLAFLSNKWKSENPEKEEMIKDWSRKSNMLEKAWDAEDTLMLIRLMKLRKRLWT